MQTVYNLHIYELNKLLIQNWGFANCGTLLLQRQMKCVAACLAPQHDSICAAGSTA